MEWGRESENKFEFLRLFRCNDRKRFDASQLAVDLVQGRRTRLQHICRAHQCSIGHFQLIAIVSLDRETERRSVDRWNPTLPELQWMLLNMDRRMLRVVRAASAVLDSRFDSSIRTVVWRRSTVSGFAPASSDCCLHCQRSPATWSMCPVSPSVCPICSAVSSNHSSSAPASWSHWSHWPRRESSVSTNRQWSSSWSRSRDLSVRRCAGQSVSNRGSTERCESMVARTRFAVDRSAWEKCCPRDHAGVSVDRERSHPRTYPAWLNHASTISRSLPEILIDEFRGRNLDWTKQREKVEREAEWTTYD